MISNVDTIIEIMLNKNRKKTADYDDSFRLIG